MAVIALMRHAANGPSPGTSAGIPASISVPDQVATVVGESSYARMRHPPSPGPPLKGPVGRAGPDL